jgi:hypothetical protein
MLKAFRRMDDLAVGQALAPPTEPHGTVLTAVTTADNASSTNKTDTATSRTWL